MMRLSISACILALGIAAAQEPDNMVFFQQAVPGPGLEGPPKIAQGVSGVFTFRREPMKGAPYAAEATTERVQVLGDGNRIVEKNSTKMYRDNEGRTRMENSVGGVGAWASTAGALSLIFIDDPVAGVHFSLHPDEKVATKLPIPKIANDVAKGTAEAKTMTFESTKVKVVRGAGATSEVSSADSATADVMVESAGPAVMVYGATAGVRKRLDPNAPQPAETSTPLGKKVIQGVEAQGTRKVVTFPAGAFGNEKALEVITEVWYTPELKMDLLRIHNDPRFGQTTYTVTSLLRGEQPRSLFEPPADYKVEEPMHSADKVIKIQKEASANKE
jgi:hypothetical protein